MPISPRGRKTDFTASYPTRTSNEVAHNAMHNLKNTLKNLSPTTASIKPEATGNTLLFAMGLAALTGAALYATRTPRIPEGIHPIEDFDLHRYLGKWYELARIDHSFERGLQRTQAEYSLNADGSIQVINRGFNAKRGEWKISHGKAKPILTPDIAALKVSFFGPFYGGYNVVALDDNYQWAMVIGSNLDYFWILSRKPSLPSGIEEQLTHQAQMLGVNMQKVLWVHQDGVNPTGNYK